MPNRVPSIFANTLPSTVIILLVSLVFGVGTNLHAQKQLPRKERKLVYDLADILTRQQEAALEQKLVKYSMETSTQIAVVLEESLEGEDPFTYAQRLAETWGIGGKANDNGILLLVSEQDREIRIQTGYGTEGFLPDATASRIIREVLRPAFRQNDYYGGLNRATDIMMDLGQGEYEGTGPSSGGGLPDWAIILGFIVLIIFLSWLTHHDDDDDGGYYRGGRYDMPDRRYRRRGGRTVIFPGGGFGGGSFGGGGGGGFGGFGGGGFGGGGAGGSW